MGTRCSITGREYGISPRPWAYDEGCISLATLRAQGTEKVLHARQPHDRSVSPEVPRPTASLGGHARGEQSASDIPVQARPPILEHDEDDPFGHALLSMDYDARGVPAMPQEPPAVQLTVGPARTAHVSHTITRFANLVWCKCCGRHAMARLGMGPIKPCRGEATGGYQTRLGRMKRGLHPMTGDPLVSFSAQAAIELAGIVLWLVHSIITTTAVISTNTLQLCVFILESILLVPVVARF